MGTQILKNDDNFLSFNLNKEIQKINSYKMKTASFIISDNENISTETDIDNPISIQLLSLPNDNIQLSQILLNIEQDLTEQSINLIIRNDILKFDRETNINYLKEIFNNSLSEFIAQTISEESDIKEKFINGNFKKLIPVIYSKYITNSVDKDDEDIYYYTNSSNDVTIYKNPNNTNSKYIDMIYKSYLSYFENHKELIQNNFDDTSPLNSFAFGASKFNDNSFYRKIHNDLNSELKLENYMIFNHSDLIIDKIYNKDNIPYLSLNIWNNGTNSEQRVISSAKHDNIDIVYGDDNKLNRTFYTYKFKYNDKIFLNSEYLEPLKEYINDILYNKNKSFKNFNKLKRVLSKMDITLSDLYNIDREVYKQFIKKINEYKSDKYIDDIETKIIGHPTINIFNYINFNNQFFTFIQNKYNILAGRNYYNDINDISINNTQTVQFLNEYTLTEQDNKIINDHMNVVSNFTLPVKYTYYDKQDGKIEIYDDNIKNYFDYENALDVKDAIFKTIIHKNTDYKVDTNRVNYRYNYLVSNIINNISKRNFKYNISIKDIDLTKMKVNKKDLIKNELFAIKNSLGVDAFINAIKSNIKDDINTLNSIVIDNVDVFCIHEYFIIINDTENIRFNNMIDQDTSKCIYCGKVVDIDLQFDTGPEYDENNQVVDKITIKRSINDILQSFKSKQNMNFVKFTYLKDNPNKSIDDANVDEISLIVDAEKDINNIKSLVNNNAYLYNFSDVDIYNPSTYSNVNEQLYNTKTNLVKYLKIMSESKIDEEKQKASIVSCKLYFTVYLPYLYLYSVLYVKSTYKGSINIDIFKSKVDKYVSSYLKEDISYLITVIKSQIKNNAITEKFTPEQFYSELVNYIKGTGISTSTDKFERNIINPINNNIIKLKEFIYNLFQNLIVKSVKLDVKLKEFSIYSKLKKGILCNNNKLYLTYNFNYKNGTKKISNSMDYNNINSNDITADKLNNVQKQKDYSLNTEIEEEIGISKDCPQLKDDISKLNPQVITIENSMSLTSPLVIAKLNEQIEINKLKLNGYYNYITDIKPASKIIIDEDDKEESIDRNVAKQQSIVLSNVKNNVIYSVMYDEIFDFIDEKEKQEKGEGRGEKINKKEDIKELYNDVFISNKTEENIKSKLNVDLNIKTTFTELFKSNSSNINKNIIKNAIHKLMIMMVKNGLDSGDTPLFNDNNLSYRDYNKGLFKNVFMPSNKFLVSKNYNSIIKLLIKGLNNIDEINSMNCLIYAFNSYLNEDIQLTDELELDTDKKIKIISKYIELEIFKNLNIQYYLINDINNLIREYYEKLYKKNETTEDENKNINELSQNEVEEINEDKANNNAEHNATSAVYDDDGNYLENISY